MSVLIRLEDLENRARAACLDFGGIMSPETLRMLCCDATAVPIVPDGAGSRWTWAARPGRFRTAAPCRGRAGSRMCSPRVRAPDLLDRMPPHHSVGARRRDEAGQSRDAVPGPPSADPLHRVDRADTRRATGVPSSEMDRLRTAAAAKSTSSPRRGGRVTPGREGLTPSGTSPTATVRRRGADGRGRPAAVAGTARRPGRAGDAAGPAGRTGPRPTRPADPQPGAGRLR